MVVMRPMAVLTTTKMTMMKLEMEMERTTRMMRRSMP